MVIDCELHIFTKTKEMRFISFCITFYCDQHYFIGIKCLLAFHGPIGMGLVRAILEDISMLIDLNNTDMHEKMLGFYINYGNSTN